MAKPAVFIDRDGVINVDRGYVHTVDVFEYIDGDLGACKKFKEMGYSLVLVTNQSGIARGIFSEDDFISLTEWMDWNFEDQGIELDGIYYCPHHATEGKGEYLQDCDCRKPNPGMLISAQSDLNIDMSKSLMIGDKADDMKAAIAADVAFKVLVRTGKAITEEGEALADAVFDGIKNVPIWLSQQA